MGYSFNKFLLCIFKLIIFSTILTFSYNFQAFSDDNKKIVYLTFDDGPSKNTELILNILKENDVHATFFIISPYIEPHIKFVQRAYEEGNAIGNHTADHEFEHIYTSEDAFFKSFNNPQEFIKYTT